MSIKSLTSCLFLVLTHTSVVLCFNLETRLPVIKRGTEGSYFGYSVAEHQSINEEKRQVEHSWLLVGAPLDQNLQPGTNRSGALWRCPLTTRTDDCEQVVTDGKRTIDSDNLMPPMKDEIKDNQWLGVTVRSQKPGGKVIVCAHRYIRKGEDFQYGQGLCYTLTQRLDFDESWEPCKGRPVQLAHEQYGYCQAGTSGLLLSDDSALIGTPGPYTWRGTVFVFNVSEDYLNRDKNFYYGPVLENDAPVDKYSYLGMSVTAGHFLSDDEMVYAAGAPRSKGTGEVVLYTKKSSTIQTLMNVRQIISGEQFASSFGYEVATADVNGDKLPDLLVGAPFYFTRELGGAVYIYMNVDHCLNCTQPLKLTGKTESRFGFAIANLGDLNKDGFEDVAIGAPYEGSGTVYIHLGSKDGLILEPSQVIRGESFQGVTTLGHSLSGGMDLDTNGYPDLLMGAYESDSVVLVRARPIVDLRTKVEPVDDITKIDPNSHGCTMDPDSEYTCFSFESCVELESQVMVEGRPVSGEVELMYKVEADHNRKFPRVWLNNPEDPDARASTMRLGVLLTLDDRTGRLRHCQAHTVYIKENTRDIQSPIAFKRSYSLEQKEPQMPREGEPLPSIDHLPILNQQEADQVFNVHFLKDCGDNNVCESQLFIEAELLLPTTGESKSSWELMLGQHAEVAVNITAYNLRESAYEAQLFISHSSSLSYIGRSKSKEKILKFWPGWLGQGKQLTCHPFNSTLVACSLGNPLSSDHPPVHLQLRFDPKDLPDSQSRLEFIVFANSTSVEEDPQGPLTLAATVVKRAELSLKGLARPEQVLYGGQVKGESAMVYKDEVGSRVLHTYQVYNQGPWRVSNLEIHIEWPYQVANNKPLGKWLLYMEEEPYIEALSGGQCYMAPNQVNPLQLVSRPGLLEAPLEPLTPTSGPLYNTTEGGTDGSIRVRRRRDAEMVVRSETYTDKDGRKHKVVNMNCLLGTAKCFKFSCVVHSLQQNQEATIFIRARLWNSTLVSDYPRVDQVSISSRAKIHIPPSLIIHQDTSDDVATVETVCKVDLLEQQAAEPVPWWIIIVAIVVGLLVLILLTLLLWKLGFFKRRRPDPTLSGNLEKHRIDDHDY
ncbi:integrin alpha-PS1-like isoform X2 [Macrosteles quadrilineatus]|uniref:integrin alpha-PS1-like isoform X2 n=1 Tax=Macrosteles quadrilineatus TaxID=74068 RepID=UPI0023E1A782|nr:integrin alpha-PS1-like isoform X2 [Macrosteles quadrilineatus]